MKKYRKELKLDLTNMKLRILNIEIELDKENPDLDTIEQELKRLKERCFIAHGGIQK